MMEEEMMKSPEQMTIDSLKNENAKAKQQMSRLEQEKRSLNARLAELETQLAEEREMVKKMAKAEAEKPKAMPKPMLDKPEKHYDHAYGLYTQKKYDEAITTFQQLLDSGISDDLADNCHYWIAASYYQMKQYDTAIEHYMRVLEYPLANKAPDAQFMMANAYWNKGDKAKAREEFQKFVNKYPTNRNVEFAKKRIAEK